MDADAKTILRQRCKEIRSSLGNETRHAASLAICANIETWDLFQSASTILTYMPIRGEVDLTPLFSRYPGKRWLIPRILPAENHRMAFHIYDPEKLVVHKFGMAEPDPSLPEISPSEIELVLVPALAYDRFGWRLGYGGGYYDRFLKGFPATSIGITYSSLLLDSVPHHAHDLPVQWVITESLILEMGH